MLFGLVSREFMSVVVFVAVYLFVVSWNWSKLELHVCAIYLRNCFELRLFTLDICFEFELR